MVLLQTLFLIPMLISPARPVGIAHIAPAREETKEIEEIPHIENSEFLNMYFQALESDIRGIEDPLERDRQIRDLLNSNAIQTIPGVVSPGSIYPLLNNIEDPIVRISLASPLNLLNRDLNFSSPSGTRIDLEIGNQIPWEELIQACPLVVILLEHQSGYLEAAFIGAIFCHTGIHTGNSSDGGDDFSGPTSDGNGIPSIPDPNLLLPSPAEGGAQAVGCGLMQDKQAPSASIWISLFASMILTLSLLRVGKREIAGC